MEAKPSVCSQQCTNAAFPSMAKSEFKSHERSQTQKAPRYPAVVYRVYGPAWGGGFSFHWDGKLMSGSRHKKIVPSHQNTGSWHQWAVVSGKITWHTKLFSVMHWSAQICNLTTRNSFVYKPLTGGKQAVFFQWRKACYKPVREDTDSLVLVPTFELCHTRHFRILLWTWAWELYSKARRTVGT